MRWPWLEFPVGKLNFSEGLELRSVVSRATLQQELSNNAFAAQPKDTGWGRRYGAEAETPLAPLLRWESTQKGAPVARRLA